MCGRYTLSLTPDQLAEMFGLQLDDPLTAWAPRYNIAPTQTAPIARMADGVLNVEMAKWGLVPSWAADTKIASSLINARAETLAEKPSFRSAFKKRRCLIPADGFYEWQKQADGKTKIPQWIRLKDRAAFCMAGLWEAWRPKDQPDAPWLISYTIVTTEPNALMAQVHNRMPVILAPGGERAWLDPAAPEPELKQLMQPYPSDLMTMHAVSTRVNSPANDDARLIEV